MPLTMQLPDYYWLWDSPSRYWPVGGTLARRRPPVFTACFLRRPHCAATAATAAALASSAGAAAPGAWSVIIYSPHRRLLLPPVRVLSARLPLSVSPLFIQFLSVTHLLSLHLASASERSLPLYLQQIAHDSVKHARLSQHCELPSSVVLAPGYRLHHLDSAQRDEHFWCLAQLYRPEQRLNRQVITANQRQHMC